MPFIHLFWCLLSPPVSDGTTGADTSLVALKGTRTSILQRFSSLVCFQFIGTSLLFIGERRCGDTADPCWRRMTCSQAIGKWSRKWTDDWLGDSCDVVVRTKLSLKAESSVYCICGLHSNPLMVVTFRSWAKDWGPGCKQMRWAPSRGCPTKAFEMGWGIWLGCLTLKTQNTLERSHCTSHLVWGHVWIPPGEDRRCCWGEGCLD